VTWLRLDDQFHRHRKVAPLSDRAWRLHVTALLECCANLTDGRIDVRLPPTWPSAPRGKKLIDAVLELETAGLWERIEEGWIAHDFLDWNPSAEQAIAKRRARQDAGSKGGKLAAIAKAKAKQTPKQLLEQTPSKTEANVYPVPVPVGSSLRTAAEDLTGSASQEAERQQHRIVCPSDLRLTDRQRATLESAMIPGWAIDAITLRFVSKAVADERDRRPIEAWRTSLASAVAGYWNDSSRKPKKPEPDAKTDDTGGYGRAEDWQ
jgi:hypothetical protein